MSKRSKSSKGTLPPQRAHQSSKQWSRLVVFVLSAAAMWFNFAKIPSVQAKQPQLTAYVPEYRVDHILEHMEFFGTLLDELIIFSATLEETGNVVFGDAAPGVLRSQIENIVEAASEHGKPRVLLSIGGGGRSGGFSMVTRTETLRQHFAKQLVDICTQFKLDGIDLDWEGPGNQQEMLNYEETLAEVKRNFLAKHLKLSVALHYWQKMSPVGIGSVDQIHLMAYDMVRKPNEGHSTFENSISASKAFLDHGVPASKLYLGVPLYARALSSPQLIKTYEELVRGAGAVEHGNNFDQDGEMYWINGIATTSQKAEWVKDNSLGGIMLWELGHDSVDEKHSLTATIAAHFRNTEGLSHEL